MSAFSGTDDQEMANLLVLAAATNGQLQWTHEAAAAETSLGFSCTTLTDPSGRATIVHQHNYDRDVESGITNSPNEDGPHPRRESLPDTLLLDDLLCIETSSTPTSFELTLALENLD